MYNLCFFQKFKIHSRTGGQKFEVWRGTVKIACKAHLFSQIWNFLKLKISKTPQPISMKLDIWKLHHSLNNLSSYEIIVKVHNFRALSIVKVWSTISRKRLNWFQRNFGVWKSVSYSTIYYCINFSEKFAVFEKKACVTRNCENSMWSSSIFTDTVFFKAQNLKNASTNFDETWYIKTTSLA